MDALTFMQADVTSQAVTCNVYDSTSERQYGGGGKTKVDQVDVAIFAPSSSSEVVVEGSGQETSFTGLVVPRYGPDGTLIHHVDVNQELRVAADESKRYEVRVKEGVPNDLDPEIWRLGLERANDSS